MKTRDASNVFPASPWPAVRWMVAAGIYLLTIAICMDQIKTKERELMEAKTMIKEIRKGLSEMAPTLEKLQHANEEMIGNAARSTAVLERMKEVEKRKGIAELENLLKAVERAKAAE